MPKGRQQREWMVWNAKKQGAMFCILCGDKFKGKDNDPLAPTIDHLVPRTHGGSRGAHNCGLAHRACNCARKDAPLTQEQWQRASDQIPAGGKRRDRFRRLCEEHGITVAEPDDV